MTTSSEHVGIVSETPAVRPRVPLAAWYVLGVLIVLYILNGLDRGLLGLLVEPVKADLRVSDFEMSLLLGFAFATFYALCGLPLGWLIDRFPRRLILYAGVTFWSCATIACGLASTYPQLLFARFALGAGEATLGPAAHSLLADIFPKERMATALSIYSAGGVIGNSAALILGGFVIGHFNEMGSVQMPFAGELRPWQAAFVTIGVPGLLLGLLALTFREPPRKQVRVKAKGEALLPFLKRRSAVFWCLLGGLGAIMTLTTGPFLWAPTHLDRAFDWSPQRIGASLGLINLVGALIGTLSFGVFVDWMVSRGHRDAHMRVLCLAILIGGPCGVAAFLVEDPTWCLVLLFCFKVTCFSYFGYGAAALQMVSPQSLRGQMAALFFVGIYLVGGGVGPALIALVTDFVFEDPQKLGLAIATVIAVLVPIGVVSAWLGRKPMAEAVEAQRNEDAAAAAAAAS